MRSFWVPGIGWYVLDKNMKKYPNDFIPSVVIQFAVFTSIFAVWLLTDCDENNQNQGQKVGNHLGSLGSLGSSIIPWFQQLQQLPVLFASIFGNLLTMLAANVACRYLPVSDVRNLVIKWYQHFDEPAHTHTQNVHIDMTYNMKLYENYMNEMIYDTWMHEYVWICMNVQCNVEDVEEGDTSGQMEHDL